MVANPNDIHHVDHWSDLCAYHSASNIPPSLPGLDFVLVIGNQPSTRLLYSWMDLHHLWYSNPLCPPLVFYSSWTMDIFNPRISVRTSVSLQDPFHYDDYHLL